MTCGNSKELRIVPIVLKQWDEVLDINISKYPLHFRRKLDEINYPTSTPAKTNDVLKFLV